MKKRIKLLLFVVFMLMITGCGNIKKSGVLNEYKYNIGSSVSNIKLKETIGYYVSDYDDNPDWSSYVILMGEMGEGDRIKIVDLRMDEQDNLEIIVKRTYSKASSRPAVLTYPYCYLNISSEPNTVKVLDREGWEYNLIE